jgi:hypothetical protein
MLDHGFGIRIAEDDEDEDEETEKQDDGDDESGEKDADGRSDARESGGWIAEKNIQDDGNGCEQELDDEDDHVECFLS